LTPPEVGAAHFAANAPDTDWGACSPAIFPTCVGVAATQLLLEVGTLSAALALAPPTSPNDTIEIVATAVSDDRHIFMSLSVRDPTDRDSSSRRVCTLWHPHVMEKRQ
jgi:hypothetical protein